MPCAARPHLWRGSDVLTLAAKRFQGSIRPCQLLSLATHGTISQGHVCCSGSATNMASPWFLPSLVGRKWTGSILSVVLILYWQVLRWDGVCR